MPRKKSAVKHTKVDAIAPRFTEGSCYYDKSVIIDSTGKPWIVDIKKGRSHRREDSTMRISRHQMLMQIAEVVARRSTCFRRNVGAVVSIDGRVVSIGYNGSPPGQPHCIGAGCAGSSGCTRAIHAELNALNYVPPSSRHLRKILYVTESPCPVCAQEIIHSRVDAVYFLHQYRITLGLDDLRIAGIKVYRMTPAGHVIDYETGEFIDAEG